MRRCLFIWFLFVFVTAGFAETARVLPLFNAHAHNDYAHERPLLDALSHGFCSVEADLWLTNGTLLVAHDAKDLNPERTFEALYLKPLQQRVVEGTGKLFPNSPPFTLLIDIKSDGASTYAELHKLLERYQPVLTRFTSNSTEANAITAIISGNAPRTLMTTQSVRFAAIDGRLLDLTNATASVHLIPLISDTWKNVSDWKGDAAASTELHGKVKSLVGMAHEQGRRIRFWAVPDHELSWNFLADAGVDLINTDKLEDLATTLRDRAQLSSVVWTNWAPRAEIAPDRITNAAAWPITFSNQKPGPAYGGVRGMVTKVTPGKPHQFTVSATGGPTNGTATPFARLTWINAGGEKIGAQDNAVAWKTNEFWHFDLVSVAPSNAVSAMIELGARFIDAGLVTFRSATLRTSPVFERQVRVSTIYERPSGTGSSAKNVEQFCAAILKLRTERPDIVCLPEAITQIGTGKSFAEVAEPIPGPATQRLGETARELRTHIVAGLVEREGPVLYNTAVLIGRDGELIGKYRKTHLPQEELEAGFTLGDEMPVFNTDFGKVGLMICWDLQFPEATRKLAEKGAEIVLMPIWGGSEALSYARAIENHVFLVTSSYDMRSFVLDPAGKILAEATKTSPLATTTINLDAPILQWWIGNMKSRTWLERRTDLR